MKTRLMTVVLAALCCLALAADDAAVYRQSIVHSPSSIVNGTDAITIPQMLSYQGKLTDTFGLPVADTVYAVRFRLYAQPTGGTQFWEENQQVGTQGGLFSTLLGSVAPIGSMPDAGAAYLGMAVAGGAELTPRLRIASAAYAYLTARAANSDLLQGKDTVAFDARYVNEGQVDAVTSSMVTNGTIAAADLGQMGASTGQVMKWTGSAWAPRNDSVGGGSLPDSVPGSFAVTTDLRVYGKGRIGPGNSNAGSAAFVAGEANAASASHSSVSGGFRNAASGEYAHIGGGAANTASALCATVSGGESDTASGSWSTVGGGYVNKARANYATVGGGSTNTASGSSATVGGGTLNIAGGSSSTVGGGSGNTASGHAATVPGGQYNRAAGSHSFAAGKDALAKHHGSFVWSDSAAAVSESVYTTGTNQFRVRARGGTWFFSNAGQTTGAYLAAGSNSWASACDSANKTDFRDVDRRELLEKLAALRVREYRMRDQQDGTRHIGPVAQDFAAAFGMGENDKSINMADMDGVTIAAIQALYEQNQAQQAEIEALKAALERR